MVVKAAVTLVSEEIVRGKFCTPTKPSCALHLSTGFLAFNLYIFSLQTRAADNTSFLAVIYEPTLNNGVSFVRTTTGFAA